MRKQRAFAGLTDAELDQIIAWLDEGAYDAVKARVNKPRPEGFGLSISKKPLQVLYAKSKKLAKINSHIKRGEKLTLSKFDGIIAGDQPASEAVHEAILQATYELATADDNSPAQLLALQRLADFPARAEFREQRLELDHQKFAHKLEMDTFRRDIATARLDLAKQSFALRQEQFASKKTASEKPDPLTACRDELKALFGPLAQCRDEETGLPIDDNYSASNADSEAEQLFNSPFQEGPSAAPSALSSPASSTSASSAPLAKTSPSSTLHTMRTVLALTLVGASLFLGKIAARAKDPQTLSTSSAEKPKFPGPQPDGTMLLPNMWSLQPAGKQIVLGDFPVNIAVHPSGKWAAVLHAGHGQHEIAILHLPEGDVVGRFPVNESFYGLTFSPNGRSLYCSGASDETIHHFQFRDGSLLDHTELRLRSVQERGIPAGIALSSDGRSLYCANVWGHSIDFVSLASGQSRQLSLSTNHLVQSTAPRVQSEDEAAISKRAEAVLDKTSSKDPFPYACVVDSKRGRLYVSLWAQSSVLVISLDSFDVISRWSTEEHPNEMLLSKNSKYLFVANANRNTVSILDPETGRTIETLIAELKPNSPPGSTPNSLALSPDEKTLFVANANINAIAVFDISEIGKSRSLGFIPVGWYPTSVRVTPDGRKLLVANGKGIIPHANRYGPQPINGAPANVREYIAGLFHGTVSIIDLPRGEKFEDQMREFTARAYACMPKSEPEERAANHPIPLRLGEKSPIKYCIYIVKENRTYDQVLGDMPEGHGDPSLCLFGENITPNHHKIAREFVLLDNFYVESEVSADGHEWTMGAYATDFVEKSWPLSYGHNKKKKYTYPSEGNFAIAFPARGYLWDVAKEAGVSYRSYGEFIANGKTPADPGRTKVKTLEGHFDPFYRSFDLDYPDAKRADRFISELARFEAEGDMPRLIVLRLPNDHTSGTTAGKHTPFAAVADNDLALGRVIEAVSHSRFWPQSAIFIVEDDAQNGPDHIDAHRTIAFVVSPYTKRKAVDSTMYTTSSMLHTIELILGLKPMSQFDAAAMPMLNSFQPTADLRPYTHEEARVDLNAKNVKTAWGGDLSRKMNFTKEDAADDLLLNEVIWRFVKGPQSRMPAPTRAAFVFASDKKDDDDD